MKKFILALVMVLLMSAYAFADVTGKVISYEKEMQNDKPIIKVVTEYKLDGKKVISNYPDGNWRTRYSAENYSEEKVLADLKTHCETITRYYIAENQQIILDKQEEIIDEVLAQPKPKIEYSIKDLCIDNLNLVIDATGEINR